MQNGQLMLPGLSLLGLAGVDFFVRLDEGDALVKAVRERFWSLSVSYMVLFPQDGDPNVLKSR
jgi:hypothetical protein